MKMTKEQMYEAVKSLLHDQVKIAEGHETQFGQGILFGLREVQNYIKFLEENFGENNGERQ